MKRLQEKIVNNSILLPLWNLSLLRVTARQTVSQNELHLQTYPLIWHQFSGFNSLWWVKIGCDCFQFFIWTSQALSAIFRFSFQDLFKDAGDMLKLEKVEIGGVRGSSLSGQVEALFNEFNNLFKAFADLKYDALDPSSEVRAVYCLMTSRNDMLGCMQGSWLISRVMWWPMHYCSWLPIFISTWTCSD